MANRIDLHNELVNILGTRNVYFQPPESITMKYPAIVYSRSDIENNYADNNVYIQTYCYKVTLIDKNPDSKIVEKLSTFPKSTFLNHFCTAGLNHDVFKIYY